MDFSPRHSIGVNYGRTSPGWLLSPQYGKNEDLFEVRYMWRRNRQFALDLRGRWRKDMQQLSAETSRRHEFDLYLRVTRGFSGN